MTNKIIWIATWADVHGLPHEYRFSAPANLAVRIDNSTRYTQCGGNVVALSDREKKKLIFRADVLQKRAVRTRRTKHEVDFTQHYCGIAAQVSRVWVS
jgi:hypothetical protein